MVIIAVSASVSEEDQTQSREAGVNAFLPKPVHWPNLVALLEEYLGLAWEVEAEDEVEIQPSEMVPPPLEELDILYDLARRGNMRAIRERADHLEEMDENLAPFAGKLRQLAKNFQEEQILTLITQYLEQQR
jgi:DNA-binding response OmpR family regulator